MVAPPTMDGDFDQRPCGVAPTTSGTTVIDDVDGILLGWSASNTNAACPETPAPCGAWWINLRNTGSGPGPLPLGPAFVTRLAFATETDALGEGCVVHEAEHVVGTLELPGFREFEETADRTGTIMQARLCASDEHGHIATGQIDLRIPYNLARA
jgi:hypothetical protein